MKQQLIFVVGCPRSGTTWLQLLLSQHPAIATLQETHLFPDYLSPALQRWGKDSKHQSDTGLTCLMDRARFIELCRQFAEQTLRVALADKPDASFILEKTPNHIFHGREILELFPGAYFVHIVRDPRAVVASLLEASGSWARLWAPHRPLPAAELWRKAVLHGRVIRGLTQRYLEVSYELMLTNPKSELARVLQMIGLDPDPAFCERAAQACSAVNLSGDSWQAWIPKTMNNIKGITVRKAQADSWRTELTRSQIGIVEYVTRDLLRTYGYVPEVSGMPWLSFRLHVRRLVRRSIRRAVRSVRALSSECWWQVESEGGE